MFWERKIQLAKEMKSAVDSETGQGEIRAMKSEIHRMQVRYEQLLKQQEKLIRDMESSVSRRDTIVTRGEFQQKLPQNRAVMQNNVQRKIVDLQKKIRESTQEAVYVEKELDVHRAKQQEQVIKMEDIQRELRQKQAENDQLEEQVDNLSSQRSTLLITLSEKQLRARYYEQIKDGKYKPQLKSPDLLEREKEKQIDRLQRYLTIIQRLSEVYPRMTKELNHIKDTIQARITNQMTRNVLSPQQPDETSARS
ncbi:unnamed protein product [Didymodactylos carnosus]|nr:unnamed protein product [Didymodactylos carnosus]CAF4214641.1 unnamed protein product [Didymodactylos carnosus]